MFHYEPVDYCGHTIYNYYYTCDTCGERLENSNTVVITVEIFGKEKIQKHYHKECVDVQKFYQLLKCE